MELFTLLEDSEDIDFIAVPPISSARTVRDINFEKLWNGPYRAKSSWFEERELTWAEVRDQDKKLSLQRKPATSKSARIRGTDGATTSPTEEEAMAMANAVSESEIKRSLTILGGKSTCVEQTDPRYIDPDLLWTKAPAFPIGITVNNTKSAADTALEKERKARKEEEKQLQRKQEEESENEQQEDSAPTPASEMDALIQAVSAYPEEARKPAKVHLNGLDEYSKLSSKPWAIVDNSDVSDFATQIPQLAIQYPFELDAFQKRAVRHLEKGESVFVAAHTSAGKTVVAEYAVALAFEHRTRLIYTSPIKALSNQKFRDFAEKFGADKVGLLTGDNSVNPDAPCVIMTTEILRSMLYRGAEMVRDVEFVVFDEVHYISDPERGVIWEEVVIMLPMHVHVVMLSATTPNTEEFSAWVGRNRREQVFVVSTEKRPVPLEHFLYVDGDMFKIMDSSNRFLKEAHTSAMNARRAKDPFADLPGRPSNNQIKRGEKNQAAQKWAYSSGSGSRNQKQGESRWMDLVKDLDKKKLLPVIIFTFSKKKVEERASALSKIDLLNAKEKSQAYMIMAKALSRLQEGDRDLPQIRRVSQLLQKGIGIHHGGLLPLLKEVVEICFTSGLVRVLIATETFAMGVNAPCRTVVFGGLRKHDGNEFRDLLPGEYIQMCGRAGRRGLDTVGTVIIHCEDDVPPLENLAAMLSGRSSKLASRFRLRYSMVLNLLRTENLTVADMMKRSFSEFARTNAVGEKAMQMKNLRKQVREAKRACFVDFTCVRTEEGSTVRDIEEYHIQMARLTNETTEMAKELLSEQHGKRARDELLRPGRVIQVSLSDIQVYSAFATIVQETFSTTNLAGEKERVYVAVVILPDNFVLPVNTPQLSKQESATSVATGSASTTKSAVGGGTLLVGKRRKNEEDDDDEFTVKRGGAGKMKGAPKPMAAPVFFERGGLPKPAAAPTNSTGSGADALPRATFGTFVSEDLDSDKPRAMAVVRITLDEIERVMGLYLEQGVSRELSQRICLERSEQDTSLLAKNLAKKLLLLDSNNFRLLDLPKDLKADQMRLVERWNQTEAHRHAIQQSLCHTCPAKNQHRALEEKLAKLQAEVKRLQKDTSDESLTLFPDFLARLEVLRRLNYIENGEEVEEEDAIELKGRVACEINTADELLLTEMVFDNVFDPLNPAEAVALLSCLILQAKCEDEIQIPTEKLAVAFERTREIANKLAELQQDYQVHLGTDDWVASVLNPGLLAVVYEWAKGRPFSTLTGLTSLEEGTIVRTITRLDETCREVKNIARLVGEPELLQKMEMASLAIKRDIVFATSLYVG